MKNLITLFLVFVSCFGSLAQVMGPNSPSTATESASGCLSCPGADWITPTNALTNNSVNTTSQLSGFPTCFMGSCYYSRDLLVSGFTFSIPTGSTINGIMAEIKKSGGGATTSPGIRDSVVSLLDATGNIVGANRSNAAPWSSISTYFTYGGSVDLWGTAWTDADINSANFGLALKAKNVSNSFQSANVDHIRITVFYSLATNTNEVYSQTSEISVFPNPSAGEILISSKKIDIENIKIFNLLGKVVCENNLINGKKTVAMNLENLPKGIYFIQTVSGGDRGFAKFAIE